MREGLWRGEGWSQCGLEAREPVAGWKHALALGRLATGTVTPLGESAGRLETAAMGGGEGEAWVAGGRTRKSLIQGKAAEGGEG